MSKAIKVTVPLITLLIGAFALPVSFAASIEEQREIFLDVFAQVERGDWSIVENLASEKQEALHKYVLWPDLRATWFRAAMRTADHAEIEAFLDHYGTLRPARELRYRYALHLA